MVSSGRGDSCQEKRGAPGPTRTKGSLTCHHRRSETGFGEVDKQSREWFGERSEVDKAFLAPYNATYGGSHAAPDICVSGEIHSGTCGYHSDSHIHSHDAIQVQRVHYLMQGTVSADGEECRVPGLESAMRLYCTVSRLAGREHLDRDFMRAQSSLDGPPGTQRAAARGRRIDNCGYPLTFVRADSPTLLSDILSYLFVTMRGWAILAKREPIELSEESRGRIVRVVRSMADDRVERGVELNRAMHCHSCDQEKSAAGSALYGAYRLCNDCLLEFTLALASGTVDSVAEFMTRTPGGSGALPPSDLDGGRDRPSIQQLNPLSGRDKLMPSNEPC
jgi:hypothetical protein